ncbi:MAG TPA: hypothetical protein VML94_01970 [Thermoplasmata archaeon]|nr:hypothetical protein [Thermoplasmata archaeon]
MEQQRPRGLRSFVQTPIGRSLLLAIGIGAVFGAFYITVLLAIPAMLIVGLWLPIYLGIKRPRYLAIAGIVIILLVAPLVTVSYTSELLVPVGAVASAPTGVDWSVTIGNTTVDSQSNQVAFSLPSGTHGYAVTPIPGYTGASSGSVVVGSSAVNQAVTFAPVKYPVTFSESGLPSGGAWTVYVGSTSRNSTTATLTISLPNGSLAYRVTTATGYVPISPSGTVHVAGGPGAVSLAFSKRAYPTTFTETGLTTGTRWGVTVGGTTVTSEGSAIVVSLPNGTDPFAASSAPEYTTPSGQTVVVAGAPAAASVAFSTVTFPVTFNDSLGASQPQWSVTIDGDRVASTGDTLVFDLPNGTFVYRTGPAAGERAVAGNATVTVAGAPVSARVNFVPTASSYGVRFTETGLAAGTEWAVTTNQTTLVSTASAVGFNLSNGAYPYTVTPIPGYTVAASGTATVAGAALGITVAYTPVVYPVTFTESNLPLDTAWNVTLNSVVHAASGPSIDLSLTNGTYRYTVPPAGGKSPPAFNATIVVDGGAVSVAIPFASAVYTVTFTESGLPTGAVIEDASLAPFHGSVSTEFSWSATIHPEFLPRGTSAPLWVDLYLSTCPGATGNNSASCNAGYPLIVLTDFFCADPTSAATCEASSYDLSQATTVTFNYTVGENGIWEWQMGAAVEDLALHVPSYALLVGDPQYNGVEGPVIGSYGVIFEEVLPSVYIEALLYLGLPFYAVLLLYAIFKNRERRREDARQRTAGPIPPTSGAEATVGPVLPGAPPLESDAARPSAPPGPVPGEHACPKCGAVVYAGESKCWKCGQSLSGTR